jgi:hypothetical protein
MLNDGRFAMSVQSLLSAPRKIDPASRAPAGFRQRLADRRRLARLDRTSAQLAELYRARTVLADARTVVEAGWIQHGWFAYRDEQGRQQPVDAYNLDQLAGRLPTGACLVGAIVQAGGGVPAAHSDWVHRALDLTWQALHGCSEPIERCPAPALRVARVRELTAWNDQPHRTAREVSALLVATGRRAADRIGRVGLATLSDHLAQVPATPTGQ